MVQSEAKDGILVPVSFCKSPGAKSLVISASVSYPAFICSSLSSQEHTPLLSQVGAY